jgi:ferric-dicitrate binding protein FerR (iron transport regulator)
MDDALLAKFLSGEATDEEVARLRAEIEADPSAVDAVVDAAQLELDLAEVLRATPAAAAPKSRRRFWIFFASAAALLIAILLGSLFLNGGSREIGTIVKVEGKCQRLGPGGRAPLAAGETLFAGEGIETNGRGRVVLRYDDGTTVEFAPGTVATGFTLRPGKAFVLDRGSLTGDVKRQEANQPMTIGTPEGVARVLGTKFTLSSTAGSTRLDVEKGKVRLTRTTDGKSADVAADQMATVGPTVAPVARPTSAAILKMAPGSWLAVPGTPLEAVAPDGVKFAATRGILGPAGVIAAWSGGAFDTRRGRLVVWGGGHTDYHGNELYAFSVETMSWQRLSDPTAKPNLGQEENSDGTPNARATYNGLAYLSQADRFFSFGGRLAGGDAGSRAIWMFDFEEKKWSRKSSSGPSPTGEIGTTCAYDPVTRKVWCGDGQGFYSYDVDADRWARHGDGDLYYFTSAVDTKRGFWVIVGNGKVFAVDIRSPHPVLQPWTTTGGAALVSQGNPGLDYDPVRDRIVGWSGGAVYALNPETKAWIATDAPGLPPPSPTGIYGRWRYVPSLDAFIVVTAASGNVHFFKPASQ